jgi:hypothetical protein
MMDLLYIIGLFVIILALAYVSYRNFVSLDERLRKIESVLQGAQVVVRPPSSFPSENADADADADAEESVVSGWGGQEGTSSSTKPIQVQKLPTSQDDDDDDDDNEVSLRMEESQGNEYEDLDVEDIDVEKTQTQTQSNPVVLPAEDELSQLEKEMGLGNTPEVVSSSSQHKPGTKYIGITAVKQALQSAGISFQKNAKKEDLIKLAEERGVVLA